MFNSQHEVYTKKSAGSLASLDFIDLSIQQFADELEYNPNDSTNSS